MTIKIVNTFGKQTGRQFKDRVTKFDERRVKAIQASARRAAEEIENDGRQDIRQGGNFESDRWQLGLKAKLSFQSRDDIRIRVTHDVSYWKVFEFGAVIEGHPLLWIPLDFAADAQGVRARDYPGQLFRIDRAGKAPLLMGGPKGAVEPKYFGKESVTIPKKWHLRDIAAATSRRLGKFFREAMKNGR